jgi:hypothetical protein
MTDMTEPTRQLLDLPRIDVPIVNAPTARIPGGGLAGAVSTATPASFTDWRFGRSSTSRSRRTPPRRCSCPCGSSRSASSLGRDDGLSGRHPSVRDDLDAVLAHLPEVRDRDLYVRRPERLPISTARR